MTVAPCVLTIGGTDPSGAAGLPADARACAAFGAHALPVVTAVVAQNTCGVAVFEAVSASLLAAQLDNILQDIAPRAVKIGMIPSAEAVEIIASRIAKLGVPIIVDPVFAPSSGAAFSSDETIAALCELLLPIAEVITPNWHEAGRLLNALVEHDEAQDAARRLQNRFKPNAVIIKGGHAPDNPREVFDYVFDGEKFHLLSAPRIGGVEVRGTGCMLASAIAAQRARDVPLLEAARHAKLWLTEQIKTAQAVGTGRRIAVARDEGGGRRDEKAPAARNPTARSAEFHPSSLLPHPSALIPQKTMKFTNEQIERFRTEGYLAVPDFWSADEVRAMQIELARLKQDGKLQNVATDGDGTTHSQTRLNLQLCPMWPHSDFYRAMPFADKVVAAVGQLIGDPVLLHLDQVFLKPGGHGAGTNWHQDNAYFKIADPLRGTALWTAVHDATLANGTMRVIPGSFREAYEHSRDPDSDHHIRCFPDESRARFIELPAGGALFFAYGTAHSTGANTTDKERAGVALHFINGAAAQKAVSGFEPGKRPILSGEGASGGENEYGTRVAGTWDSEVARVLREN